jgi:manganese efflux pump family protein
VSWPGLAAIAFALAMDAVAVAIVAGMSSLPLTARRVFRLAFHFGLFQALMPILGWSLGTAVLSYVASVDHWIAFGLLTFVGGKMLLESRQAHRDGDAATDSTRGWALVLLSVATSIDALAVGLSLAMLGTSILLPALVIGVITAVLTAMGMAGGRRLGVLWGRRVEALGGLILIGIGLRILFEHLGAGG